ncbi:ATP-binding protein [Dictyobacter kobayashii]|uniref:histidine kinase n=1 Tax=Dictyobacter kobayashii TaxID=2014872 RepID=A0A402AMD1_9CHLR|nr:ATP-binding protein [Dictyobacter kobayashii]GCE20331.1 histidine kinase [Dictyobacter kobayashii]
MNTSQSSKEYAAQLNAPAENVDLTNCDREPIHIPGSIQPHGILMVLSIPDLHITQVSNNTDTHLGTEPARLLGQHIAQLLPADQVEQLTQSLRLEAIETVNPLVITIQDSKGQEKTFDGVVHRVDGHEKELLLLELEPTLDTNNIYIPNFYQVMRTSATVLQGASNLLDMCQASAEAVRRLTGFDRVLIYRFHEDWHGEVIAEARNEDQEAYLGLHYPASDIPAQARELYRHNWLRLISDVAYQPAPIIPTDNPLTQTPLNLSSSVLRSVSPMHIMYLKNMGVAASMSISIIKNNMLWGLISCHHNAPRLVPYTVRAACEFLGQLLSLQIAAREDVDDYAYEMQVKNIQASLLERIRGDQNPFEQIVEHATELMSLVNAQGAAVYFNDRYVPLGMAPAATDGMRIVGWLKENMQNDVFVTDNFSNYWKDAQQWQDTASGLLAISISPSQGSYVLWFRPEVVREVTWSGDPHKPVQMQDGSAMLLPRTSFAAWSETVRFRSQAWKACELEAARGLRSAIVDNVLRDLVVQRADELADLNKMLEESNQELDSFAYIVSHDLKEPLRGINNYVHILKEDYSQSLNEEGLSRLATLLRLTQRLDTLIDSLLHYSRVGRVDLAFAETDLNEVLDSVLELLRARIEEHQIEIRVPRPLPTIWCDRARIGEIFTNLITNAMKYNDKADKWIEIGYQQPEDSQQPLVFYVRDNGIGIRDKYFDSIFRIFKRLHGRDKFGGGTGAGLTIVKRIVERHKGTIWPESTFGEGTTFYFTLQEG